MVSGSATGSVNTLMISESLNRWGGFLPRDIIEGYCCGQKKPRQQRRGLVEFLKLKSIN